MNLLSWILFGALAGWLASKLMGTDQEHGVLANIAVGVVGAMIGGFLFSKFGGKDITGFNLYSLGVAVVGSMLLLAVLKALRK